MLFLKKMRETDVYIFVISIIKLPQPELICIIKITSFRPVGTAHPSDGIKKHNRFLVKVDGATTGMQLVYLSFSIAKKDNIEMYNSSSIALLTMCIS